MFRHQNSLSKERTNDQMKRFDVVVRNLEAAHTNLVDSKYSDNTQVIERSAELVDTIKAFIDAMKDQNQSPSVLTNNLTIAGLLDAGINARELIDKIQFRDICFVESAKAASVIFSKMSGDNALSLNQIAGFTDDMQWLASANRLAFKAIKMTDLSSLNSLEVHELCLKIENSMNVMLIANKRHNKSANTAFNIVCGALCLSTAAGVIGMFMMFFPYLFTTDSTYQNSPNIANNGRSTFIGGASIALCLLFLFTVTKLIYNKFQRYSISDTDINYQSHQATLFAINKIAKLADVKFWDKVIDVRIDGGNTDVALDANGVNVVDQSLSAALLV
jgi:hypothetical protein